MDPIIELGQALEGADLHPEIVEIQEQPAGDDDQPAVDGAVGGLDEPEEVGAGQGPVDGLPPPKSLLSLTIVSSSVTPGPSWAHLS